MVWCFFIAWRISSDYVIHLVVLSSSATEDSRTSNFLVDAATSQDKEKYAITNKNIKATLKEKWDIVSLKEDF